jgi:hypothetical protein
MPLLEPADLLGQYYQYYQYYQYILCDLLDLLLQMLL